MLFLIVKWIHVLSAITAVGANLTYSFWIRRASRQPESLPFVLKTIRLIDQRVANPCYAVLFVTGLAMAFIVPTSLSTPWLLTAIVLYILAALLGIFIYTPVVKEQVRMLESAGLQSPGYQAVARRSALLGMLVTLDVVIIVFLMVVKPALW
jgi:uncharacterized membrane protein